MMSALSRVVAAVAVTVAALTLGGAPAGADQTILGHKVLIKHKPGFPETRQVRMDAKEVPTTSTLGGDPSVDGASLTLIVQGGTSTTQTFTLGTGIAPSTLKAHWRRKPTDTMLPALSWQYKDKLGDSSAVAKLTIKVVETSKAQLQVRINGKYGQPVSAVPPNPGSYVGAVFTINGAGGDDYCVNLGGAAGGYFVQGGEAKFAIKKAVAEATCPDPSATCGDNVASPPNETCDGTDDAACPGLCGSNGVPCACPFCGDSVQDPTEECDGVDQAACSEGCSYTCICTTCGNDVAQPPAEDCDGIDDGSCPALCLPPGNQNQCRCPICGDDDVNQASEECDGTATGTACDGLCVPAFETNECKCPVCGNDVTEPGEDCDGTDDAACSGLCLGNCTCPP